MLQRRGARVTRAGIALRWSLAAGSLGLLGLTTGLELWWRSPAGQRTWVGLAGVLALRLAWLPLALLAFRAWTSQRALVDGPGIDAGMLDALARSDFARQAQTDAHRAARIRAVLDAAERLEIAFQPIVRLTDRQTVGFEALARFRTEPYLAPDVWFAEAAELGLGVELEVWSVRQALKQVDLVPPHAYIALNVSAATMASADLVEALVSAAPTRIVLELTEHERVPDYPALSDRIAALRHVGVRIAIDDTGAGFASLQHVLEMAPDIIKLDGALVAGIEHDGNRLALARSLTALAKNLGATLVAECVETEVQRDVLASLDVRCGQGYLFGRPGPLVPALS